MLWLSNLLIEIFLIFLQSLCNTHRTKPLELGSWNLKKSLSYEHILDQKHSLTDTCCPWPIQQLKIEGKGTFCTYIGILWHVCAYLALVENCSHTFACFGNLVKHMFAHFSMHVFSHFIRVCIISGIISNFCFILHTFKYRCELLTYFGLVCYFSLS